MAERELAILVRARDLSTPTIRAIKREVGDLSRTVGQGLGSLAKNLERGLVMAGGAAVAGIGYALKAAGDFQAQMQTINTVAMRTPEALREIGHEIRAIARETGTPLEELTTGYYDLVSAGIDASQATDVLRNSNTLAIGGLATAAESVDLLTTALNSYGVEASKQGAESERFADIFAKAIERGKVTAAELAASFANIGPIAAANGIEIEELAAAYAELTARGIPAAEASTMMASAMVALMRRTGELERLEKATGKSYLAIAGERGLVASLEELRVDAEKAGIPLIDLMGRVEGLQFATNTTGPALEGYNETLAEMAKAHGTAAAQMSERQQGLNFQLGRLKALAHDAAITIGEALLPKVIPKIQELVEWLATHQKEVDQFGKDVAAAFDEVVTAIGKIPWETVGAALQTAGAGAKTVMEWFLKAPAWLQTAILTGWGLNKLTGGMVGTLVSELGKGLIRGVLNMAAAVVNVRGGVVNGPGGPGAPTGPGGRPGGGRIPIVPILGALGVAAIAPSSNDNSAAENNDRIRLERGEITQQQFDALWNHPAAGREAEKLDRVYSTLREHRQHLANQDRNLAIVAAEERLTRQGVQQMLPNTAVTAARTLDTSSAARSLLAPLQGILGKNFSPTIHVRTNTSVAVSVAEWKRIERSAQTSYSTLTAGI